MSRLGRNLLHSTLKSHPKAEEYGTFAWVNLFVNLVIVSYIFMYSSAGASNVAQRMVEGLVFSIASLVALRFWGKLALSVNLIMLAGYHCTLVASFWLGGMNAPGIIWIPASLIVTSYYFEIGYAIFWGVSFLGGLAALLSLEKMGLVPPPDLPLITIEQFRQSAIFGAGMLAVILSWSYRKTRDGIAQINTKSLEELTHLRIELEKQLEENKTMVRVLTHDFTNMITVADGWAAQLKESGLAKTKIKNSMDMMLRMIHSLRNYRSALDGKVELELTAVDVHKSFETVAKIFEEKLLEKQLQIKVSSPEVHHFVKFDEQILVAQIFSNIISNSIKFTPAGTSIDVTVSAHEKMVSISIRDHGIGMPAQIMNDLFQFGKKTTRTGLAGERGTGFGMPIVKTFIENFGGTISVRSWEKETHPENHGTEFIITLPKAPASLYQVS